MTRARAHCGLLVIAALACASPEERFAEHVAEGESLAAEGRPREAILAYRSALKIDPTSAEVSERLGDLLLAQGELGGVGYLREAYRLDPDRVEVAMRAARLLMAESPQESFELIREALRRHRDRAIVHTARSELALTRNDTRGAIAAARRAVEVEPDYWQGWYQLGRAHQARIHEFMMRDRTPPDALFRATVEAFETADERAGASISSQLERARVLGLWGRNKLAREGFEGAMDLAHASDSWTDDARIALEAIAYAQEAEDFPFLEWGLRELVDATPDHIGAWSRLADVVEARGGDAQAVVEELIRERPDDPAAHLVYASFLLEHGQGPRALEHLRELIAGELDSPLLWEYLARIQLRRLQIGPARDTHAEMRERFPDDPITRRTGARLAIALGRYDEATRILRSLEAEGGGPEVQRLLAVAEMRRGNLPAAGAAIERALPPGGEPSADILRLKALIHHDSGEWDLALDTFGKLRRRGLRPRPGEQLLIARSLYESNRTGAGRKRLVRLLESGRAPAAAAVEYARREQDRDPDGARRYLVEALESQPTDGEVLEALTELDLRNGRARAALRRLDRVVASGEARADVVLLRAHVLAKLGQLDRAESDALRAFEVEPRLEGAAELLFAIYRARGSLEEARRSFEEAEAAGVLHVGARLLLARIYRHSGDTRKARQLLERVVAASPEMAKARSELAYVLADEGRELDRALELAEDVQRLAGRDADVADTVGYVYLRKGLHEAALQQFRYAIELARDARAGTPPRYHYHLGLALQALGRGKQAAAAFERALELDAEFADADDARRQLEATRGGPGPS